MSTNGQGYSAYGASATTTCPTTSANQRTVKGKIRDKDGGEREYTATVVVNDVAPTAVFHAPGSLNEGAAFTLSLTDARHPDPNAIFSYSFDCGGGQGYTAYSTSNSVTCPTNDNGQGMVKAKLKALGG